MSYKVIIKNGKNVIFESDTNTEIEVGVSSKEINAITRKLNLGSGFNGWTPAFFIGLGDV